MSIERLETKLKESGLRLTGPRKVVYTQLSKSSKALSAKELFERIEAHSEANADLASVYRNLDLFSEIGIVHEVFSGKYSLCAQADHKGHVHVVTVCSRCGQANEVKSHSEGLCSLMNSLKKQTGQLKSVSSITLQGLCGSCLS